MGGISASKIAGLSGAERPPPIGVAVAILAAIAWTAIAVTQRDELYDGAAVVASTVALVAAVTFYVWRPSPAREGYRLLGIFVSGQTFLSSGLSVIRRVNTTVLPSVPSQESFSFAVESSVAFGAAFLVGAFLTAPSRDDREPVPPSSVGLTSPIALTLAVIASFLLLEGALTTTVDNIGRWGFLPQVVFNVTLISPMLAATWLLTGRSTRVPLMIILASHLAITFYTSMLGIVAFAIRDILLAYIFLRKQVPVLLLACLVVGILLFNPVKMIFRTQIAERRASDSALTFEQATSFWEEGVDDVWSRQPQRSSGGWDAVDVTASRLDYNWVSAHVHATVGRRIPYELGGTYEDIPMMFVPRILYPNKPTSSGYTRTRWLLKLDLVTRRSAERVAFAVPASAEAYWNFGWPGVFGVAALLGMAVGGLLRLAPRDPVARTGYCVMVAVMLGQFLDMLVWLVPLFAAALIAAVLAPLFCRMGRLRLRSTIAASPPPAQPARRPESVSDGG